MTSFMFQERSNAYIGVQTFHRKLKINSMFIRKGEVEYMPSQKRSQTLTA